MQQLPEVAMGQAAVCTRCGDVLYRPSRSKSNMMCAAVALSALILYPLGIFLPVLRLEQLGHVQSASIWDGTISLIGKGQWVIGTIVLVCSIVIPLLKLAGIFLLCAREPVLAKQHRAEIYRWIEILGKWGMIDVLLVALLVAAVKLGDMVVVDPGPGAVAFAACVLLSLIATACFDPHAIWESEK